MNAYFFFGKIILKVCKILNIKNAKWRLSQTYPTLFFEPHLKKGELRLFDKVIRDKKVLLEYGSGGSTIDVVKRGKRVFSVESNPQFFAFMMSIRLIKKAFGKNLVYHFVNLGPTNEWGKPLSKEPSASWKAYYKEIWDKIDPRKDKVDLVFVDGRFRVCCCLYSVVKALEYGWNDTVFAIHDFWRRKEYHAVLNYLDEVESAANLAVFRIKPGVNVRELNEQIEQHSLAVV